MNEVGYIIQAVAASAVAGGMIGALIQSAKDDKIIAKKNSAIRKLRRQLADRDKPSAVAPSVNNNNDWMRETIKFPLQEEDR